MVDFKQLKSTLQSLPLINCEVDENTRLIEDCGLSEDDLSELFFYLKMLMDINVPDDDVYYRFCGHMPLSDLVDSFNSESNEI